MQRFTELYLELDGSNRTTAKLAALERYFAAAPAIDAAWATYFLMGQRLKRVVKTGDLRAWAAAACGFPLWMVEECYQHVGDLAETLALLMHYRGQSGAEFAAPPLHELIETRILALRGLAAEAQRELMLATWSELSGDACFVLNKLITGGLRVGVSQSLVNRALAEQAGVTPADMAHRLMGAWQPTAENFRRLLEPDAAQDDASRPYPFCLAYPLEDKDPAALGPVADWQIEWKWDGIRAQLIQRGGDVLLWSRGEELVMEQFPEVVEAAQRWPGEVVLDGELLAWSGDGPAGFADLQRRLGRKNPGPKLRREVPVIFMAYDLLERAGVDYRAQGTRQRREALEAYAGQVRDGSLRLSPLVAADSWQQASEWRATARQHRVEGLMLKHQDADYAAGRKKGGWWKWKVDPYTVDAVLVYAQQGHGRRAGLYTDYTFSIWRGGELVPFAKAYSGLTDREIREVDRWIRQHTLESHGPVRVVEPQLVFEIAFEGISPSKRHKSGIAVRFPRIHRWRRDKAARAADSLDTVLALAI